MIGVITRWTLHQLLRSWTGWFGGVGFALINGLVLWMLLSESSNPILGSGAEVHQVLMPQYLSTMALLLMLLSPVLHMNSIAGDVVEDRWTLYQVVPVSNLDIALGKWMGLCIYSGLLLLTTLPSLLWLNLHTELIWHRWSIGYFSLLVFGSWLHALGLWMSSLCQRPWAAWMASAGLSLTLWFCGSLDDTVWEYISPIPKINEALDGWLSLADVLFWVSTITGFLYWTQDALAKKYWSIRRPFESRLHPWMWAVVLCLGNAVGLRYNQYWDFNSIRQTLSTESIFILEHINSPVVFSIRMSPQDPRRPHLEKWLRSIEHLPMVTIETPDHLESGLHKNAGLYIEYNGRVESISGAMDPNTIHHTLKELLNPEKTILCMTQGGGEPNIFDVVELQGIGLWTEILLTNGYKPRVISGHKAPDSSCELMAIVGRETALEASWLASTRDIPTLILLDPAQEGVSTEWLSTIGVITKDDFVVEPNPQFQMANNPTTLVASKVNLQPHPTLHIEGHQILLDTMRSIQWNPQHTEHLGLELLHASPQSWAEVDYQLDNPKPTDGVDTIGRVPIMVEVSTVSNGMPSPHWMVLGSSSLVHNHLLERNPFNGLFALHLLENLQEKSVSLPKLSTEDVRVSLHSTALTQFIWLWIVGLPSGLLSLFSLRRWMHRTK